MAVIRKRSIPTDRHALRLSARFYCDESLKKERKIRKRTTGLKEEERRESKEVKKEEKKK